MLDKILEQNDKNFCSTHFQSAENQLVKCA